jgi:capsular polysaccharide biosynthesis protein/Mrp family chromosome partitioning ATPase
MNPQAAPDYFELSDYAGVLRRRWRRIAACALAGLVLAAAYVVAGPKTYTATVLVQVNALPNNANAVGGRTGGPVNMDNEAQSVRSIAVAQIVKAHLNSPQSAADLAQTIHVTVPPNSTFLQISCKASTAHAAARCANSAGRAYLYNRRVNIMNLLGAGINALKAQAKRLRDKIKNYKVLLLTIRHQPNRLSGTPTEIGDELLLSAAQTAMAAVQAHIDAALPLFASVSVADSTIVGLIASPATVPTSPSSPRKLLFLPSGLIAGVVLGMAWAFLRERRDKRIHSVRDVERLGNLPTLLSLTGKPHGIVTGLESPRSAAGRAFSELARYIDASCGDGNHVLAVAATSPGAAGSAVAVNLAAALARTSDRTVLICADLNATKAPELLGVPRGRGLSEVLTGAARVSEVANPAASQPRLRIITPGLDAARAVLAMQQAKLRRLISDAMDDARYVVIEVQSLGEDSDSFGLAQLAEAAILAVEVERSRPADITDCALRLGRFGTPVLGTAILRPVRLSTRKGHQIEATPGRRFQTEVDPLSSGAATAPTVWTPGTPKVSAEMVDYSATSAPRGPQETKPLPRVTATERDRYLSSADPATGD